MPLIAPSVLSADFLNLGRDLDMINRSEADWFHLDVMDGRFVPNISYGLPVIKAIKKQAGKTLDTHLMIVEPERYFEAFAEAGADILTIHYEASTHLHRSIQAIRALGMQPGVAINPHTPVHLLDEILDQVYVVLVMSVNPGFGGQNFIPGALNKVRTLKEKITAGGFSTLIEVDGGVTEGNAAALVEAGADVLVAGNTVFTAPDPEAMIRKLKNAGK